MDGAVMAAAVEVFVQLGGSGVVGFHVWVIECVVRARVCVGGEWGWVAGARRYPTERNRPVRGRGSARTPTLAFQQQFFSSVPDGITAPLLLLPLQLFFFFCTHKKKLCCLL